MSHGATRFDMVGCCVSNDSIDTKNKTCSVCMQVWYPILCWGWRLAGGWPSPGGWWGGCSSWSPAGPGTRTVWGRSSWPPRLEGSAAAEGSTDSQSSWWPKEETERRLIVYIITLIKEIIFTVIQKNRNWNVVYYDVFESCKYQQTNQTNLWYIF